MKKNASPKLLKELTALTAGLLFPSESDIPIEVVAFDDRSGAEALIRKLYPQPDVSVSEPEWADFYQKYAAPKAWHDETQQQFAAGFAEILDLLKSNLTKIRIFRIGAVRIAIYVIGESSDGVLMGFQTASVET